MSTAPGTDLLQDGIRTCETKPGGQVDQIQGLRSNMKESEIKTVFFLQKVNHDELLSVFLTHFGHSTHPALSKWYKYSKKQDGEPLLEVEVNNEGRIVEIILSDELRNDEVAELSTKIRATLIDNQEFKVAESVLFAIDNRIDGFFRYRDKFQILPVPEGSPKANQTIAYHPFLLQFGFISCPDPSISAMRRRKLQTELVRFLSFFTHGTVREEPSYSGFAWVVKTDEAGTFSSEYRQVGYFYKDLRGERRTYTDCSALKPIDTLAATNYFQIHGDFNRTRLNFLLLPDNLTDLLDAAANLSANDQEKFFFACTWFYYSREIWFDSFSASFVALITALECLTEKPTRCRECSSPKKDEIERCSTCGEPRYRLASNFKQLLERYGPPIDQYKPEKKLMYNVRSQLTHGLSLLNRDVEPGNWISSKQNEQHELHRNVRFITQVAIYNWLIEKSQCNQTKLSPPPTKSEWLSFAKTIGANQ